MAAQVQFTTISTFSPGRTSRLVRLKLSVEPEQSIPSKSAKKCIRLSSLFTVVLMCLDEN